MKKLILITGVNGFLGRHLVKGLKDKYTIIGLANTVNNLHRENEYSFKVYSTKDILLEDIFLKNKIYAIIHAATKYKRIEEQTSRLIDTNIVLPIRLIEMAVKYDVKAFLNTDSFFNDETLDYSYLSQYTLSKKHCLQWLKTYVEMSNCKIINIKIFHMYGENDSLNKFIPTIISKLKMNESVIKLTKGEQTRDFIYVKDVVNAYKTILNSIHKLDLYHEFDLGTGESTSIKKLTEKLKLLTNSNSDLKFGVLPYRKGEIMFSKADCSELNRLGWIPSFSLIEGFKNYLLNEK